METDMDLASKFFTVFGLISTISAIFIFVYGVILWCRGIFPVLLRLGKGLAKYKIAIFATDPHGRELKKLLTASGLYRARNITSINPEGDPAEAEDATVLLVYWPDCTDRLEDIISRAHKDTRIIVYAPADQDNLDSNNVRMLRQKNNAVLTTFKGRLQGDLLLAMMTRK